MGSMTRALKRDATIDQRLHEKAAKLRKQQQVRMLEAVSKAKTESSSMKQEIRKSEQDEADVEEVQRLIRNGVIDIRHVHSLTYLSGTWLGVKGSFRSRSSFMRALSRVYWQLQGRDKNGAWPNGTRDRLEKEEQEECETQTK